MTLRRCLPEKAFVDLHDSLKTCYLHLTKLFTKAATLRARYEMMFIFYQTGFLETESFPKVMCNKHKKPLADLLNYMY